MSNRLFIFMALHAEAKPLIKCLQLKRENVSGGFDVYVNQEAGIYLWLTGTGSIAAATAVGSCMTCYGAGGQDILINIGTCAAECETGQIFLCNRIMEQISGFTFYPDIWYRHGFREAELITVPKVLERGVLSVGDFCERGNFCKMEKRDLDEDSARESGKMRLYDMEAAAVYQAASYYLGPHQMCFLKIVSDAGEGRTVAAEMLTVLMERNTDRILGQMDWLRRSAAMWDSSMAEAVDEMQVSTDRGQSFDFASGQQEDCQRLCAELHCSQTMRAAVEQCVRYWTLAGVDYQQTLEQMREDGLLPCRDKREGKQRFEELRKQLL